MVRVDSLAIWNFSKNLIRSRNLDSTGSKNVAIEKIEIFKISSDEFKGIRICYKIYVELSDR